MVGRNVGVSFKGSRDAGVGVDVNSIGDDMSSAFCCFLTEDDSPLLEAGLSGDLSGDRLPSR